MVDLRSCTADLCDIQRVALHAFQLGLKSLLHRHISEDLESRV